MRAPSDSVRATCVFCDSPRRVVHGSPPMLCGAAPCVHRHAALPAFRKCRVCTTPLLPAEWAREVCAEDGCRLAWLQRRIPPAMRQSWERRILGAEVRRNRAAGQRGIPADERASWRVSVLPRNRDRPSALPARRREAFEAHLRRNLAEARARFAAGGPMPSASLPASRSDVSPAERDAEAALLGAGCAACRGNCCKEGGNHAFNTSDTMLAYLHRFPEQDDESIVARWLSYLQPRSMTYGCVYQVHDGCALPRDLRGHTCNAYYCEGLKMIRGRYAPGEPVRAYFVHREDDRFTGGQFVQIAVRRG
ncbi:MAG: hypothetical protein ACK6DP_04030 [Gemmatimonas sp.]|jgi:hypothetical protein|uniref:hypothetical protein n=1 Tax=Gemmatimonas sp. TaxID=1962908 RepID=UPI00391F1D58|nr:hypothetical protein [Gemmatimonadota bacterium]